MDSSDSIRAWLQVFTFSWNPAAQDPSGQNWAPPQEPQLLPAWTSPYHIKYFHLIKYNILLYQLLNIVSYHYIKYKIILYCIILYLKKKNTMVSYCIILYHIIPFNIFSYSIKWLSFRYRHKDGRTDGICFRFFRWKIILNFFI